MRERILVVVKAYPALSKKYGEIVCTAGITEDGRWIRIYPLPFRKLKREYQFSKYQWIELDLERNFKDFRPESYRPVDYTKIQLGKKISTEKGTWITRRKLVLKNVFTKMEHLITEAKNREKLTSLAVFKPKKILGMVIIETDDQWSEDKIANLKSKRLQGKLFDTEEEEDIEAFEVVNKLPWKFQLTFEDESGKKPTLMIEDWEIGALYWNCLKKHQGDEKKACKDVQKKYEDFARTTDYHLILGTALRHHLTARNPFMIVGDFRPPPILQAELFTD